MSRLVDHAYASPQTNEGIVAAEAVPLGNPTSVRYRIVALSMGMSLVLYLDRFALAPITTTICSDLNISKETFGWGNFAFFLSYALLQVPAGALADRFGARRMLALYVVAWSLATIALGFVYGWVGLILLRIVMGAMQAGAYPAAGGYLKRWASLTARAKANSLVAAGGRVGALLAFLTTAWVGQQFQQQLGFGQGWRGALGVFGSVGLIWTAIFWWYFRDRPSEHRGCNAAELAVIGNEPVTRAVEPLPVIAVLSNPNVWILSVSGFLTNVGWIFLTAWLTTYLVENFSDQLKEMFPRAAASAGFKDVLAGVLTAVTACAAIAGGVSGGICADLFRRQFGPIWGRRIPGLLAGGISAIAYIACHFVADIRLFMLLMVLTAYTIDFGLGSLWATYQDIGGKHVGSVLGFANMWGNLGAAVCGWYYGRLADQDNWQLVFTISAAALILMSLSWLLVNPTRTLDSAK
ncbi:MFS transporter [Anatilimnocola floriformis]|uniref:MFS transporter n=1 Tax=Anatilimnocola floriformis TaxID=2948575 RepID=UPI0020C4EE71|nr:MFS transporter [Anatilimnocola floriformis]